MGKRSQSSGLFRLRFESRLDWLAVVLGVLLAGIHAYLGLTAGEPQFLVVGAGFLAGVAFFLTRYWRPVLYLLGAVYALALGFLWVLNGMEYRTVGVVTGAVSLAFFALVVYLFVREGGLLAES